MKKGKTRVLALALALLCVCGTAACSSKEGETSSAAGKTSSAGSAASSKQANAKPSGELTQESLKSYPVTPESQFETEDVSGGVSVTWCYSEDAVVVVPKTIKGKPVVEIGGQGMKALPTCRGIVLPDSVEIIKFDAFCADENLECIDLGKSLKTIEFGAFDDCNKLKTVTFPDGLESISEGDKNGIFFVSSALHEVYIPASTTKIGNVLMHKDCPNAVIVTPAGSAAEKWAKANNVPVKNQ